jgi:predicted nucleic acid-binding protein
VQFVDTNILLYANSSDPADEDKAAIADALLHKTDIALSVQVLQEFYWQATRVNRRWRMSHDEAQGLIESWLRFKVQDVTLEILKAALNSSQRYKISYWDAAIIEAARTLGCSRIYSEDLNDGQNYAGVIVTNPFSKKRRSSKS